MRKVKLLLAVGAVALVALAAMSATTGAFRAAISRAGAISSASLGALTFEAGTTVTCNVTLAGSLLLTATIVAGTKIGEITEVRTASCSGGTVREILVGTGARAWPITINSVPAGLPNSVTGIELLLNNASFNLGLFGAIECLYRGNVPSTLALSAIRGSPGSYTTGLRGILTNTENFISGSGLCLRMGTLRGGTAFTRQTLTVS